MGGVLHRENEIQRNGQGMMLLRPEVSKLVKEGQNKVVSPRIVAKRQIEAKEARLIMEELVYSKVGAPVRKAVLLDFVCEWHHSQRLVLFAKC